MKIFAITLLSLVLYAGKISALTGIPEPGAIFYGKVTLAGSTAASAISSISWTITEPGTGRMVELSVGSGIELSSHNGESWFIARVPFQTTNVIGFAFDPLPAGTFALSSNPVNFDRATVIVNSLPALLKAPAPTSFSLPESGISPASHSRLERVDLEISGSFQALYDTWIAGYFPAGDSRALLDADPDNDGIKNLMERALGLNPNEFSAVPVANGTTTIEGLNYFTFSYFLPAAAPDAPLTPEISTDTQSWLSGAAVLMEISNVPERGGRLITVRGTVPMSQTHRAFIRLKATALRQ